jgi:flagellar protein FliJ
VKRFQFRLEQLLNLRKHQEREWELKLADITGKCLLLENGIRACERNILASLDDRRSEGGALDIQSFMTHELYTARLRQEIKAHRAELEIRHRERAEIQLGYLEAAKKRKVLDKLKERRAAEYYLVAKREEFNTADEVNNASLIRAGLFS